MLTNTLRGDGLIARAMRSSAWTLGGYGAAQAIRLASNLILTRILFPETFGMMALVTIAMVGLQQFSDVGIGPSINQNRRGDDPDFLDTAWTIQVVRGLMLWGATCALAWPVSQFYGEPQLLHLLPATGLTLVISGFNPTRIETAHRHLMIGRVTLLDLGSQIVGLAATIGLAIAIRSVWALVIGGIAASIAKLVLCKVFLPGQSNRFHWEPAAAHDLIHFGKWIFLSTMCGFMIAQGDRVILGKYLSLEMLGIYNIGYFLASFPLLLGGAVVGRVMIPLYRECPPAASAGNYRKLHLMRMPLTSLLLALLMVLAFFGVKVVGMLYDSRYHLAGPIVVLIASLQLPQVIGLTYDQAALAAGDSRRFFVLLSSRAALMTSFMLIGAHNWGLIGALVGQGLATALVYPVVIWIARRYRAWDPMHDVTFALVGGAFGALALWLNQDALAPLLMH
ncbi:MAG: oligosaccharide flippase family protein [Amaricoccus sp.]|uniref:oligosaccharide flippase family protein n=1 Tax=Amaricoccus sp. TaxID=1872485 RepID=UPI003314793B